LNLLSGFRCHPACPDEGREAQRGTRFKRRGIIRPLRRNLGSPSTQKF
jgi:hypothetical protein